MGIFAKRNIQAEEELTFNYNVDRYGHDAQECYCGEPNCVGFIGGKTQTDIAGMDDLYLEGKDSHSVLEAFAASNAIYVQPWVLQTMSKSSSLKARKSASHASSMRISSFVLSQQCVFG